MKKAATGAANKEEKEFMDQSTKKNLMNVKSKLDRAMNDLTQQIMPVFLCLSKHQTPAEKISRTSRLTKAMSTIMSPKV